jgi:hypothetical protein
MTKAQKKIAFKSYATSGKLIEDNGVNTFYRVWSGGVMPYVVFLLIKKTGKVSMHSLSCMELFSEHNGKSYRGCVDTQKKESYRFHLSYFVGSGLIDTDI